MGELLTFGFPENVVESFKNARIVAMSSNLTCLSIVHLHQKTGSSEQNRSFEPLLTIEGWDKQE
jgi:hypothetical protein